MRIWLVMIVFFSSLAWPVHADEDRGEEKENKNQEESWENDTDNGFGRGRKFRRRKGRGHGHGWGRGKGQRRRRRRGRKRYKGNQGNHLDEGAANPIQFVQELINAGKIEEAEKLLNGLEGDEAVLESFRGILAIKRNRFKKAISHFARALELKPNQTAIWLYSAQAYFQTDRYQESLDALEKGKAIGKKLPSYFQLKARVEERLGFVEQAYGTLEQARRSFAAHAELIREQALLLIKAGLYAAAMKKGGEYLARRPDDRDAYLVLGEALRKTGRPREAEVILEGAALRFKQDPEILARLAFAYSTDRRTLAAARLLRRATLAGGDYAFAGAEYFRLVGRFREAIEMNERVRDPKKRLSQRLAIYIGGSHFGRAASLAQPLIAARALNDTNKYRLAYANLRVGDLDRAEKLCRQIRDPALTGSAAGLLRTIAERRKRLLD